jgi:hypothetical protein
LRGCAGELLAALQSAERRLRSKIDQANPIGPLIWNAVQESLRSIGSALFLAFAFASMCRPGRPSGSRHGSQ